MSPHPVDVASVRGILSGMPSGEPSIAQLIRMLVQTRRDPKPDVSERIINEIATAPFDPRMARIPIRERGLTYQNRTLLDHDDSLFVHLVRRVLIDGQWALGTSAGQYLDDLHRAASAPEARLAIYFRRGGYLATTLTSTNRALPESRRGPRSLPELLVVYSADRGIIVTGYQVSSVVIAGIPEDARWLQ